ncbi:MAG: hypothetical protein IPI75_05515 [Gammaproteobacteria bacterium]|nr:hypothetical protein [Gammaproteobacteria bacterium]
MTSRNPLTLAICAAALHVASPAALAADGWEATLTPYLWAMGMDGDINVGAREINASADFSDIWDNMDIGGSAMFELNKGRWVNYLQVDYLAIDNGGAEVRNTGLEADIESDSTLGALATGYRFDGFGERSTIDVLVGVRYAKLDTQIDIKPLGQVDSDHKQYDGMVMLRPHLALGKNWSFSPTLSVGAGDSDLVWELSPQFEYAWCNYELRLGYRNLNYDLEDGNRSLDLTIHGPMVGFGFKF